MENFTLWSARTIQSTTEISEPVTTPTMWKDVGKQLTETVVVVELLALVLPPAHLPHVSNVWILCKKNIVNNIN